MTRDEAKQLAEDIDRTEADLVMLQSRLWSVRQRLQKYVGRPVGFQYDEPNERGSHEGSLMPRIR